MRVINVELGQRYGADAWKAHVTALDTLVVRAPAPSLSRLLSGVR